MPRPREILDPHRLVLPTRESHYEAGVKVYTIRCVCGWSWTAEPFTAATAAWREHRAEQGA